MKSITPTYSRRTDQSVLDQSSSHLVTDNHILKLRDKLANEVSISKQKDLEIEKLRVTVAQLNNDKRMLIRELQQAYEGNENANSSILNESSIQQSKLEFNKNTANFESINRNRK